MNTYIGAYSYNTTFYTGTNVQPDVLNIFIKPEKESKIFMQNALPLANWAGLAPVASLFTGAIRVANAVETIFKELSNLNLHAEEDSTDKSEVWNASKNIVRGIVEMIPFTCLILILFEAIRFAIHSHEIAETLKEKENIAGVALEGKVIFTIDIGRIDRIIQDRNGDSDLNACRLQTFVYVCKSFLEKSEEKGAIIGMDELFPKLENL